MTQKNGEAPDYALMVTPCPVAAGSALPVGPDGRLERLIRVVAESFQLRWRRRRPLADLLAALLAPPDLDDHLAGAALCQVL